MIINLTPHEVNILGRDSSSKPIVIKTVPPSGTVARCDTIRREAGTAEGITVFRITPGQVYGLPAPTQNTIYIVSALVRLQVPNRKDVFSPGSVSRDLTGRIIGCWGLDSN